ncbi:VASt domain-containing protein [Haematococcus lacustris]|uniref:VASt domain-containing protein n=1 Tax=Haematococcus lacustris TaxID=44745 RepID=A0A699Z162_HAELA|nr:VASt domain-containing protein [Haematococcus lacustris]
MCADEGLLVRFCSLHLADGSNLAAQGRSVFEATLGLAGSSGFVRSLHFTQPRKAPNPRDADCVQRQQFAVFQGEGQQAGMPAYLDLASKHRAAGTSAETSAETAHLTAPVQRPDLSGPQRKKTAFRRLAKELHPDVQGHSAAH